MAYLMGTDEAGYGPNLGPLVISATVWRVPDESFDADLYERLSDVICRLPERGGEPRVAMADSKQLYSSGGGVAMLERGVLAALGVTDESPRHWRDVWRLLAPDSVAQLDAQPWFAGYDAPIPRDAAGDEIDGQRERLAAGLRDAGVSLMRLRAAAIFPQQFNELVDRHGNKATALSHVTLTLLRDLLAPLGDEPLLIHCDKHGGRNKYGPLLQEIFPDFLVEVRHEGRASSVYRWGPPRRRVEIRFVAKGESFLPSALASMVSKYLRELAMRPFNDFWCGRVANLQPTAGYPVDAARFRSEIRTAQTELGIADHVLWRKR